MCQNAYVSDIGRVMLEIFHRFRRKLHGGKSCILKRCEEDIIWKVQIESVFSEFLFSLLGNIEKYHKQFYHIVRYDLSVVWSGASTESSSDIASHHGML